jgi:hypothetical protein
MGSVIQIWATRSEQGFEYRQHGETDQILSDFEGLTLVTTYKRPKPVVSGE